MREEWREPRTLNANYICPHDFCSKSDEKRGGCFVAVAVRMNSDFQRPSEPGNRDTRDEPLYSCTCDFSFWGMKTFHIRTEKRWRKGETENQGKGRLV